MNKNLIKIVLRAIIISLIGVLFIDYFSHLLFSNPMETGPYFMAKMFLYFLFSIIFLSSVQLERNEFRKVLIAGITVSLIWGTYYNILPILFDFYPFGIPLNGLKFLGMGIFGTGLAFGIVHTIAFVGGYYSSKLFKRNIKYLSHNNI